MNNLIYSNNCHNQNRGNKPSSSKKKKKFDFKKYKTNTFHSLNDVEHFLRNMNSFTNYIRLYKILK